MREDQIDGAERIDTMRNDKLVREQRQGTTLHQFALSQADEINQGRFRSQGVPSVTGSAAIVKYPQASTPFQSDPVPPEPPLGFAIDQMFADESSAPMVEAPGAPADAAPSTESPTPAAVESAAGAPFFSEEREND
jgi:hypothetical protein